MNSRVGKHGCLMEAISGRWAKQSMADHSSSRVRSTAAMMEGFNCQAMRLA